MTFGDCLFNQWILQSPIICSHSLSSDYGPHWTWIFGCVSLLRIGREVDAFLSLGWKYPCIHLHGPKVHLNRIGIIPSFLDCETPWHQRYSSGKNLDHHVQTKKKVIFCNHGNLQHVRGNRKKIGSVLFVSFSQHPTQRPMWLDNTVNKDFTIQLWLHQMCFIKHKSSLLRIMPNERGANVTINEVTWLPFR
jgi:hypothetical protein